MERGHAVWVRNRAAKADPSQDAWLTGIVKDKAIGADGSTNVKVSINDTEILSYRIPKGDDESTDLKLKNQANLHEVDDLNILAHLNEPEIINTLQFRFFKSSQIFTFTGRILIAMNPSGVVQPGTSSQRLIQRYADTIRRRMDLVFDSVSLDNNNQKSSILISGESGSGKSETANMLLKCIAGKNATQNAWFQKVLSANYLLDTFGNARTANSENSSRFGKVIDLSLSSDNILNGCEFRTYLLETSRTVSQFPNERSFNIFYQLLSGASDDDRDRWNLKPASFYNYTAQGGEHLAVANYKDDRIKFKTFTDLANSLGFTKKELTSLFDLVIAILELGEIAFTDNDAGTGGGCIILDEHDVWGPLQRSAELLGISADALKELLTIKFITTPNGDNIRKMLTFSQAVAVRDAVSKALYRSLFEWLVECVNDKLRCAKLEPHVSFMQSSMNAAFDDNNTNEDSNSCNNGILLVDIFGFDSFEKNCLEQLCINYANETLQQLFNFHIFKQEVELYASEGVHFPGFTFADNQANIDLIGNGIFASLDDQCKLPNPSDKRFYSVLCTKMVGKRLFVASRSQQQLLLFSVTHFAGVVEYTAEGIIDRNTDSLPAETSRVLGMSVNTVMNAICSPFPNNATNNYINNGNNNGCSGNNTVRRRSLLAQQTIDFTTTSASNTMNNKQIRNTPSFVSQVKSELSLFVSEVRHTTPHYIRCLHPFTRPKLYSGVPTISSNNNSNNIASLSINPLTGTSSLCSPLNKFDHQSVVEQLKYSGIFEAIRIARTGFHSKLNFLEFYSRYRVIVHTLQADEAYRFPRITDDVEAAKTMVTELLTIILSFKPKSYIDLKNAGDVLLPIVSFKKDNIQLGHTYVFSKRWEHENLELLRAHALRKDAVILQRHLRGLYHRQHYQKMKRFSRVVQRYYRGFATRLYLRRSRLLLLVVVYLQRQFRKKKFFHGILCIQCLFRCALAKRQYRVLQQEQEKLLHLYGPLLIAKNMRTRRKLDKLTKSIYQRATLLSLEQKLSLYAKYEEDIVDHVQLMISGARLPVPFQCQSTDFAALLRSLQDHMRRLHMCPLRTVLKKAIVLLKPAHFLLKTRALIQDSFVGRTLGPTLWVKVGLSFLLDKKDKKNNKNTSNNNKNSAVSTSNKKEMHQSSFVLDEHHALFARIRDVIQELLRAEEECVYELKDIDDKRQQLLQKLRLGCDDGMIKIEQTSLDERMQEVRFLESVLFMLRKYYDAFVRKLVKDFGMSSAFCKSCPSSAEYVRRLIVIVQQFKQGHVKVFQHANDRKEFFNYAGFLAKLECKDKQDLFAFERQQQFQFDQLKEKEIGLIQKINVLNEKRILSMAEATLKFTELDSIAYQHAPKYPSEHYIVNSLLSVLQNETTPLSWLVKVAAGIHVNGKISYYQATKGLVKKSLSDILYDPVGVELLDSQSFTAALITTCVFHLTALQPQHILIKSKAINKFPTNNHQKNGNPQNNLVASNEPIQIVGFHTDDLLAKQFHECTRETFRKPFSQKNINVLFCLPHMDEALDPFFVNTITQPGMCEEIVCAWLCDLHLQNERFLRLRDHNFTSSDFQALNVPIRVAPQLSLILLKRLQLLVCLIQNKLSDDNDGVYRPVTHAEVLELFFLELNFVFNELRHSSDFAEGVEIDGLASFAYVYHNALQKAADIGPNNKNTNNNGYNNVNSNNNRIFPGTPSIIASSTNSITNNTVISSNDSKNNFNSSLSFLFTPDNCNSDNNNNNNGTNVNTSGGNALRTRSSAVRNSIVEHAAATAAKEALHNLRQEEEAEEDEVQGDSENEQNEVEDEDVYTEKVNKYYVDFDKESGDDDNNDNDDAGTYNEQEEDDEDDDNNNDDYEYEEEELGYGDFYPDTDNHSDENIDFSDAKNSRSSLKHRNMMLSEDNEGFGYDTFATYNEDNYDPYSHNDEHSHSFNDFQFNNDLLLSPLNKKSYNNSDNNTSNNNRKKKDNNKNNAALKRKTITLLPADEEEVDLYATFDDPDKHLTQNTVELPFKQLEAFTKKTKAKKEKDKWIMEVTKRTFDAKSNNNSANNSMKPRDITVEEEAFHFLRRLDWRNLAKISPKQRAIDCCANLGKSLAFLPSLWFNFIEDWQLKAFFRTWLKCYNYIDLQNAQVPLLTCEIILHFNSMEQLNKVKDWPVLVRLSRRLRLDLKFALSTSSPAQLLMTDTLETSCRTSKNKTINNTSSLNMMLQHNVDDLHYDLYGYNPSSWDDSDDEDEEDEGVLQGEAQPRNDPKLVEALALRKQLLNIVFSCANLLAEEDVARLERDILLLKDVIHQVCFGRDEDELPAGLLSSFCQLLLDYPGLADIGSVLAKKGKFKRNKAFVLRLLTHTLVERFESCIMSFLHAHPELLLFSDRETGLMFCDFVKRLDDKRYSSCKYRLLTQFVNFAAEPAQRTFQFATATAAVSPINYNSNTNNNSNSVSGDTAAVSEIQQSVSRGIFSVYRGEEELIVIATHFDYVATSSELRNRRFNFEKCDTQLRTHLLLRLLLEEVQARVLCVATQYQQQLNVNSSSVMSRVTQATHCYRLVCKAMKERVLCHEITAKEAEDTMWSMLGLDPLYRINVDNYTASMSCYNRNNNCKRNNTNKNNKNNHNSNTNNIEDDDSYGDNYDSDSEANEEENSNIINDDSVIHWDNKSEESFVVTQWESVSQKELKKRFRLTDRMLAGSVIVRDMYANWCPGSSSVSQQSASNNMVINTPHSPTESVRANRFTFSPTSPRRSQKQPESVSVFGAVPTSPESRVSQTVFSPTAKNNRTVAFHDDNDGNYSNLNNNNNMYTDDNNQHYLNTPPRNTIIDNNNVDNNKVNIHSDDIRDTSVSANSNQLYRRAVKQRSKLQTLAQDPVAEEKEKDNIIHNNTTNSTIINTNISISNDSNNKSKIVSAENNVKVKTKVSSPLRTSWIKFLPHEKEEEEEANGKRETTETKEANQFSPFKSLVVSTTTEYGRDKVVSKNDNTDKITTVVPNFPSSVNGNNNSGKSNADVDNNNSTTNINAKIVDKTVNGSDKSEVNHIFTNVSVAKVFPNNIGAVFESVHDNDDSRVAGVSPAAVSSDGSSEAKSSDTNILHNTNIHKNIAITNNTNSIHRNSNANNDNMKTYNTAYSLSDDFSLNSRAKTNDDKLLSGMTNPLRAKLAKLHPASAKKPPFAFPTPAVNTASDNNNTDNGSNNSETSATILSVRSRTTNLNEGGACAVGSGDEALLKGVDNPLKARMRLATARNSIGINNKF